MKSIVIVALSGSVGAMFGSEDAWWAVALFLAVGVLSLIWAARGAQQPTQRPFRPERCNVYPVPTYDWERHFSPTSVHGANCPTRLEPQAARKVAGRGGIS